MVRHVFLWQVTPDGDPEAIVRALNTLPDTVPGIRSWSLGRHMKDPLTPAGPWQYALVCDFDSFDDLQRYDAHPAHQDVVAQVLPHFAARAVVDFEFEPAR